MKQEKIDIKNLKDKDIDYSDIPELDNAFWDNAILVPPKNKVLVSIRFDSDVLDYFKNTGKGYQSRINQVLKSYISSQKQKLSS